MERFTTRQLEAFSRGFDHGNFANAYETEDCDVMLQSAKIPKKHGKEFTEGAILGFFLSYELHEIPGEYVDEVERLRNVCAEISDHAGVAI